MDENVDLDDPVGWLLVESDRRLVGIKLGPTRLGFALSLKFFELHARFSESIDEFAQLEREGVASFERAFDELIAALDEKAASVRT